MCGIAGVWSARAGATVEAMASTLSHRGPDASGTLADGSLHLGHRRLAIIDLSERGRQPMSTEDGRWTISYNGEIYNFQALRRRLEHRGHQFTSDTDTEVLLRGWQEWGESVLEEVYGMFAFAVWDARRRELVLVRDATGIKPLLYVDPEDGPFAFASEVRSLLDLPGVTAELDSGGIKTFLQLGFPWDYRSVVDGVRALPPGHLMRVREGRPDDPEPWWQPPSPEPIDDHPEALDRRADQLHDRLHEVVEQHLIADVPVGLMLSGGLDSSILAALAQQHLSQPLQTVSIGFDPAQGVTDERDHARLVAEHVGSDHTEFELTPADVERDFRRHADVYDDLFWDPGLITSLKPYRKCREAGLTVMLVGEGADEVFGGYSQFRRLTSGWTQLLPDWLHRYWAYRDYTWCQYGTPRRAIMDCLKDLHAEAGGDWFHAIRLFETRHQLPANLNMKVDRASMAASIEARVPYQDRRIVEFAFRLPRSALIRENRTKHLLRRMARRHDLLPDAVLDRPKYGNMIPLWMDHHEGFRSFASRVILDEGEWAHRLGRASEIRRFFAGSRDVFRRYLRSCPYAGLLAWKLLVLESWHRRLTAPASAPA